MTQVARTPVLEIAYEEHDPSAKDVVILLHGFPDDVRTWDAVLARPEFPMCRTIVPWLRGFGETRFRNSEEPRRAQASALARDVIDLLDALDIERCTLVGHDWGARAAYGAAVLAPERIERLVALSVGYGTNVPGQTMSLAQVEAYWYHWFFATPRGEAELREERARFCRFLWERWSPGWQFSAEEYDRTARAFESADFVDVVLHSYRHRWGFAAADPRYAADDARMAPLPPITVPTLVLHGDRDGATLLEATADREPYFTSRYERDVLAGFGHFIQREAPQAVAAAIARAME